MSGPYLRDEAILLRQRPSGEKYTSYAFITENNGVLHALARISQKAHSTPRPDLYDQGGLGLNLTNNGGSNFFKTFDLNNKRRGIGSSYESLSAAAQITNLYLSNPIHEENSSDLFQLAQRSLDALDRDVHPNAALIKCLFLFSRYEGYPIKEEWFKNLPDAETSYAAHIINTPLTEISVDRSILGTVLSSIQHYLEHHTDIRI
tara:strand:+ start:664 stop:1275 length:612 start_codon:yes stop_codon:yes gene_type:complete